MSNKCKNTTDFTFVRKISGIYKDIIRVRQDLINFASMGTILCLLGQTFFDNIILVNL